MGQSSARRRASPVADPADSYPIKDVIEVKVSYGAPAPGFILIPDGFRPTSPESLVGEVVVIHAPGPPDNRFNFMAKIAGVRDHGTTVSLLVENWDNSYPPPRVGWSVEVPNAEGQASESLASLDEPMMTARRKRLAHLARMVFELMGERYQGGTLHKYDGVEDARLIDALRACSRHTEQIGCLNFDDMFVIQIEGVDGLDYIIQFSLYDPGFTLIAALVSVTKLAMLDELEGGGFGQSMTMNTLDVSQEYRERIRPGRVNADLAFLLGMAKIIGFMDRPGEDEDESLRPLAEWIMPTPDELRELRAKLPPSKINYDEEGEQPY